MKNVRYTIYLSNRTTLCITETKPDDCPRSIARDFREALATGMLVIGDIEESFFMIPVANIMHIECLPVDDEDDREYGLARRFEEDEDDEFDEDDELEDADD